MARLPQRLRHIPIWAGNPPRQDSSTRGHRYSARLRAVIVYLHRQNWSSRQIQDILSDFYHVDLPIVAITNQFRNNDRTQWLE